MSPVPAVILQSGQLRAEVLPASGGALARLDWLGRGANFPLFRNLPVGIYPVPSQLACFPLVPWSNRMAPGGFIFQGRDYHPASNREGEPCPIHGEGWQREWDVARQAGDCVELVLDCSAGSPFSYVATLGYAIAGDSLRVDLSVRNEGSEPMPFGLGLHPWFVREPGVTVQACARSVWQRADLGLPGLQVPLPHEWDFNTARALPPSLIDNVFAGWDGVARIVWPSGMALDIAADMQYFILYAPVDRDVFCFEPVDHAINAHNLPGGAARNGLTVLAAGQTLRRTVSFTLTAP